MGIHRLNRHQFHLKNLCDPARLPHRCLEQRWVEPRFRYFEPALREGYHLDCLRTNSKDGGWLYHASHSVFPLVRFALIHVSFILVRCVFSNRRCVLTRDPFFSAKLSTLESFCPPCACVPRCETSVCLSAVSTSSHQQTSRGAASRPSNLHSLLSLAIWRGVTR